MPAVQWTEDAIEVEAADIARAMRLAVEYFLRQMKNGRIRALVERGTGTDAGRHRLSFRAPDRELTLVVSDDGTILDEALTLRAPAG